MLQILRTAKVSNEHFLSDNKPQATCLVPFDDKKLEHFETAKMIEGKCSKKNVVRINKVVECETSDKYDRHS